MDVSVDAGAAVLAVTVLEEDRAALERIFTGAGWRFHHARDCAAALKLIRELAIPVVVCDSHLSQGCWRDLHAVVREAGNAPAIIVASAAADDLLWAEVLNVGGFDVLAKPFAKQEVLWAARIAWEEWKARRQATSTGAGA